MRTQRTLAGLTLINLMLLIGLVTERVRPAVAKEERAGCEDFGDARRIGNVSVG
jgi:hypothetical protein